MMKVRKRIIMGWILSWWNCYIRRDHDVYIAQGPRGQCMVSRYCGYKTVVVPLP